MGKASKHNFFSKAVSLLDSFGHPIHLTLQKKRAITSQLGGILTIALAIIIFYQATSQFVNMANHKKPQLYQMQDLEETPSIVSFKKTENFFLAVVLTVNSVIINITAESPFNFPTYYKKYRTQEDGSIAQNNYLLLWAPCNQSDFPSEIYGEETFTSISLQMGYCAYGINYLDTTTGICPEDILSKYPDCVTPLDMEIQGDSSSNKFDFLQTNFKICDQSDTTIPHGITCTSDNMTETFETNIYEVSLYFASTAVNMLNYKAPNQTFIEDIYWKLNPNISKTADIYVDKITVEDSDDYFSSRQNNRSYYNINTGKVRETDRYLTKRTTKFLQWNMKRSNTNLVICRTYAKIPDILIDIGGFSKSAFFVMAFLVVGFVRYKYQILLANGLYDFELNGTSEKAAMNNNMVTFSSMDGFENQNNASVLESSARSAIPASSRERNAPSNKPVVDYFEKLNKRGKLDDSEWNYFKSIICCCRKRKNSQTKLAAKARELAARDLDLFWSGRKMVEFKILKTLILNANQRDVFDFFENPLLTLEDQQTLKQIKDLRASVTSPVSASTATATATASPAKSKDMNFSFSQASKNLAEGGFDNEGEGESPSNIKKLKLKQRGRLTKSKTITDDQQIVDYRRRTKRTMSTMKKPSESEDAFSSLSKYGRLYMAYRHLKEDENLSNRVINRKLIYSLSPDLRKVFKRIDQILGDDYTVEQFEHVVENILEAPNCLLSIRK